MTPLMRYSTFVTTKKIIELVLSAVLAIFLSLGWLGVEEPTEPALPDEQVKGEVTEIAEVVRVVDGDTVQLGSGEKLRYIGIDTPETVAPNQPVGCFGKEASARNSELVLGKEVRLELDRNDTDRYGRLLRYVYVGDIMINEQLVREGYAISNPYPPDTKYQDLFDEAQIQAQLEGLGIWGDGCATFQQ